MTFRCAAVVRSTITPMSALMSPKQQMHMKRISGSTIHWLYWPQELDGLS